MEVSVSTTDHMKLEDVPLSGVLEILRWYNSNDLKYLKNISVHFYLQKASVSFEVNDSTEAEIAASFCKKFEEKYRKSKTLWEKFKSWIIT
jgi:hypothetical protein